MVWKHGSLQSNDLCFVCQAKLWVLPNRRRIRSFQMGPVAGGAISPQVWDSKRA